MSDIMEFGFDDAKVIKNQGVDQFKQTRSGETSRISVISFKKFHDVVLAAKAREKGSPLTDQEKFELITKIDTRLSEQLKKPVDQLTEVDRLDIKHPRFSFAYTHYKDGVGTIRCLSKYENGVCVKPEMCCDKIGDADQTVGAVIMTYPTNQDGDVDEDLLKQKKYTGVNVYKLSSKKFKRLESAYKDAREDKRQIIDLKVKLDGDPKYQKQEISAGPNAVWAREGFDPSLRAWVLDQGLRAWKHVQGVLGYEMKKELLAEKLGQTSSSQLSSGAQSAETPKLQSSYDELLS